MKLADFRKYSKVYATRFHDGDVALFITKTGDVWRVLADQDGRCTATGDHAASKYEAFTCVLPVVAKNWGLIDDDEPLPRMGRWTDHRGNTI